MVVMQIKVSVIIPNYNGIDYLEKCMDSLMKQDVRSFEVIVVDDASKDDSMECVMRKYPENGAFPITRYLRHSENKGFCGSVNDGVAIAKAPYVLLLNNDTVVDTSFVKEMYYAIRRSEKIFSVQGKMLSLQNPGIMDDAGDYYCALGWAFALGKGKKATIFNRERKIFAACGGAAIYRKDVLQKLGGFDENHFAYLEDIDIGYRAKLHGYQNLFTDKAIVSHVGSATSGSRYNPFKAKLTARNSIYIIYKNMPNWQIILNFPLLIPGFLIKFTFYILKGMGKTYWKGWKEGLELCKSENGKMHRQDFSKIGFGRIFQLEMELLVNIIRRFQ